MTAQIGYMDLDDTDRTLVSMACEGAHNWIRVSPLDKGLSGAKVLMARWEVAKGHSSAPFVLKIGTTEKLQWELSAVKEHVQAVYPNAGSIQLFTLPKADRALLRQGYIGPKEGNPESFRSALQSAQSPTAAITLIKDLFDDHMKEWHCDEHECPDECHQTFAQAFDGRTDRLSNLSGTIEEIGPEALDRSLTALGYISTSEIVSGANSLIEIEDSFADGLIHGDLHAQNVLVDPKRQLHLIDFAWSKRGWKAIDFIMMECSLKFLSLPAEIPVESLLQMEAVLEQPNADLEQLSSALYGKKLVVLASAVREIRRQATKWRAMRDFEQYRKGLIVLGSCISTYPQLNRNFLLHSLAYHLGRCANG